MHYYRYTCQFEDENFETHDAAFDSDTQARATIFQWYVKKENIAALWLFRYNSLDTSDSFRIIDHLERPATIKF